MIDGAHCRRSEAVSDGSSSPVDEPSGAVDLGVPTRSGQECLEFVGFVHDLDDSPLAAVTEATEVEVRSVFDDEGILVVRGVASCLVDEVDEPGTPTVFANSSTAPSANSPPSRRCGAHRRVVLAQ
jgi:hypothetical protein